MNNQARQRQAVIRLLAVINDGKPETMSAWEDGYGSQLTPMFTEVVTVFGIQDSEIVDAYTEWMKQYGEDESDADG